MRKGVPQSSNAEGHGAYARCFPRVVGGRRRTSCREAASVGVRRSRWRRSAREEDPGYRNIARRFQNRRPYSPGDSKGARGGEKAIRLLGFGRGNSEARENHGSGEERSVTSLSSPHVSLTPRQAHTHHRDLSPVALWRGGDWS
jgi:hypothetical protein